MVSSIMWGMFEKHDSNDSSRMVIILTAVFSVRRFVVPADGPGIPLMLFKYDLSLNTL